jgi:hypothetical protein
MSTNHALVDVCRAHGYEIEFQQNFDGTLDRDTSIVSFPCETPDGVPLADDLTAVEELEIVKNLQTTYSDNSVSATVYYRPHELDGIKEWLKNNYRDNVKTISFLLQYDHCFAQAPYESITKEKYEEMKARVKPIKSCEGFVVTLPEELDTSLECAGGACPLR